MDWKTAVLLLSWYSVQTKVVKTISLASPWQTATAIDLAGPKARGMLMKLTTLDMDRSAFTEGEVAGSNFGAAQATLWQTASDEEKGGPVFRLFVRRSMADYLWCLLAEAGFEWGMPRQAPLSGETWRLER